MSVTNAEVERLCEPIFRGEPCPVCHEPWKPSPFERERLANVTVLIHKDECWLVVEGQRRFT